MLGRARSYLSENVSEGWAVYWLAGAISILLVRHYQILAPHWPAIRRAIRVWFTTVGLE